MKNWTCFLVVALSLLLATFLSGSNGEATKLDENGVYDFREDPGFDTATESERVLAVMFHDPHMAGSENVHHEFRSAIKELREEGVEMKYGVVDISNTNTQGLMRRFAMQTVPAFLVFHEGTPHQYFHNFTRMGIMEEMRKHASPDWKAEQKSEGSVVELKDTDFPDFIQSRRAVMVMFHAPWCNHCKQMMPMYSAAAHSMLKNKPPVPFGRIDGSAYADLSARYNVSGFPTLLLFRNGVEKLYDGARAPGPLMKFIKSRIAPASTELKPLPNAVKTFSVVTRDTAMLGIFASETVPEFLMFQDIADAFRDDFKSAHMVGAEAIALGREEFGLKKSDQYGFLLLKDPRLPVAKGQAKFSVFDGDSLDMDAGRRFVSDHYRSLVNFATQDNWMQRFVSTRPLLLVLTDIDWEATKLIQHEINQIVEVAEQFPDINYAIGDPEDLGNMIPQLGLGDHDEDVVACYLPDKDARFPLEGKFTAKRMIEHLQKHKKGELKPFLRSQKEPGRNPGPVKTMVATSFERMADESKDVLVLFTSQVSKDCQKFEGVLKKVQKDLAADSVLFFRYDVDNNDLPPGANDMVKASPKLALWKAGQDRSTAPMVYDGKRRVDTIIEFIRKNAVTLQEPAQHEEL